MIIQHDVIVVQDRDTGDVVEVFGRMIDYNTWLKETKTDPDRIVAESYATNFSLKVEINE